MKNFMAAEEYFIMSIKIIMRLFESLIMLYKKPTGRDLEELKRKIMKMRGAEVKVFLKQRYK